MRPSGASGLGLEGWVQFSADAGGVRCLRERDLLEKMRRAGGNSGLLGNGRDAAGHKGSGWKREQMERLRGFPGG